MTIPDYQDCMLPLLVALNDGNEWSSKDVTKRLSDDFGLNEDERQQMLPSGQTRTIVNRVGWAKHYLKEAGLIASVRRGIMQITEVGMSVLEDKPSRLDSKYLEKFPSYIAFRDRKKESSEGDGDNSSNENPNTPDDLIIHAYKELQNALAEELLQIVKDMTDQQFEVLVVDLLVAMGYGGSIEDAGKAVGKTGDGGIDGVIKEDKLGLDEIVVQAKRWTTNSVGRPEIQAFAGSMEARRANKGVFITTSFFSSPAIEYVTQIQRKIVLVDGEKLARLMIDHNIGVATYQSVHLKRLDMDFFNE